MLQKNRHTHDPAIPKNEDFCGKCTYYSPHILRGIIGFFSVWQQKMMCSFMVAPLFTPNLLWGLL